jgi:hypothetical protein
MIFNGRCIFKFIYLILTDKVVELDCGFKSLLKESSVFGVLEASSQFLETSLLLGEVIA